MSLPAALREWLAAQVGEAQSVAPVSGGCVDEALRVQTAGAAYFLKHRPAAPVGFYAAEARGLELLAAARAGLTVPAVLAWRDAEPGGAPAALLLEWLEPAPRAADFDQRLGAGLAALHRVRGPRWGGMPDGYIGPLVQRGAGPLDWPGFWRESRLEPQLRLARRRGVTLGEAGEWQRLFHALDELLAPAAADGPSLLHGDLWGGNVMATAAGPALIDPAAYYGHREVDLAMTELFGGFGPRFYESYARAWPLAPGYAERRRAVYQLYYLLVHVNLFGEGYRLQTVQTLREALRAC